MKKLIKLAMVVFVAFTMANCVQYTPGPSCTLGLLATCYDYSKSNTTAQKIGETVCKAELGTWATTGCTYSKCGNPDSNGVTTCTN